jgi:hypothetical protein
VGKRAESCELGPTGDRRSVCSAHKPHPCCAKNLLLCKKPIGSRASTQPRQIRPRGQIPIRPTLMRSLRTAAHFR